jgi:ZIP family zinc transporter
LPFQPCCCIISPRATTPQTGEGSTFNTTLTILLLSLTAGLGTALGGLIAIIRKPGKRSFGFLMGFAAGVMLTLSFVDLMAEAWELSGYWVATLGFGIGAFLMLLVDVITPHTRFGETEGDTGDRRLLRTGMLMAIGISIHNMPEGAAVGAGYMHLPQFGLFIAAAIALHNIPEGIATALPLCTGGMCARDSFAVAFLSGLVEPIGAVATALLLGHFQSLIPAALAFAGGVMVFLTLDELVPTAREYGHQHFTAIGIILGAMFVFLLSGALGV